MDVIDVSYIEMEGVCLTWTRSDYPYHIILPVPISKSSSADNTGLTTLLRSNCGLHDVSYKYKIAFHKDATSKDVLRSFLHGLLLDHAILEHGVGAECVKYGRKDVCLQRVMQDEEIRAEDVFERLWEGLRARGWRLDEDVMRIRRGQNRE